MVNLASAPAGSLHIGIKLCAYIAVGRSRSITFGEFAEILAQYHVFLAYRHHRRDFQRIVFVRRSACPPCGKSALVPIIRIQRCRSDNLIGHKIEINDIVFHSDVCNRFTQETSSVKFCCRFGIVRKLSLVKSARPYIVLLIGRRIFVVGRNNLQSFLACRTVRTVGIPYFLIEIHMSYHQAVTRYVSIPTDFLPVFQKEIFVSVHIRIDDISLIVFNCISQLCVKQRILQFFRFHPTHEHLFVCSVTARSIAIVIVAPAVHQAVITHAITVTAGISVSIINVRQAQTVRELMTESTYAVNCSTAISSQLARASIRTYGHTIKLYIVLSSHIESMRPDGIGATALSFAITCIKHEYQVNKSVTVLIIISEIYFRIKGLASVFHHRRSIYIA